MIWRERYATSLPRDHRPCSIYCLSSSSKTSSSHERQFVLGLVKSSKSCTKSRLGFLLLKKDEIAFERLVDLDGTSFRCTHHTHWYIQCRCSHKHELSHNTHWYIQCGCSHKHESTHTVSFINVNNPTSQNTAIVERIRVPFDSSSSFSEESESDDSYEASSSSQSSSSHLISVATSTPSNNIIVALADSSSSTLYCISPDPPHKIIKRFDLNYVPFQIVPSKIKSDEIYVCGDGQNVQSYTTTTTTSDEKTSCEVKPIATSLPKTSIITCLDLNESDEIQVVGTQKGNVTTYFDRTRTYEGPICDVKVLNKSSCLIGSAAGFVCILDRQDKKSRALPGLRPNQAVTCICMIESSCLAVGTHDGRVLIYDITDADDEYKSNVSQTLSFAEPVFALSSHDPSTLVVVTARRVHLYHSHGEHTASVS